MNVQNMRICEGGCRGEYMKCKYMWTGIQSPFINTLKDIYYKDREYVKQDAEVYPAVEEYTIYKIYMNTQNIRINEHTEYRNKWTYRIWEYTKQDAEAYPAVEEGVKMNRRLLPQVALQHNQYIFKTCRAPDRGCNHITSAKLGVFRPPAPSLVRNV